MMTRMIDARKLSSIQLSVNKPERARRHVSDQDHSETDDHLHRTAAAHDVQSAVKLEMR
jgi:hypothetical protein